MLRLPLISNAFRACIMRPRILTPVRFASAAAQKSLSMEVTSDGVAVITFDAPDAKVNTLSDRLMSEFEEVMQQIESDSNIRAAVIKSAKPDNFIAGADIEMLDKCKSAEELTALSHNGQKIMDRIAGSKRPIVAAINGSCLGGGLELALACHYRIATSNPKTTLGLPEVMLGLLPGAGGTQRLPRTISLQESITAMTTGKNYKADKARKIGLVHQVADPYALDNAAMQAARDLASGTLKGKSKSKAMMAKLLEDNPIGRSVLFKKAGDMIAKKAGPHYPSPMKILECVRTGIEQGIESGSQKERENFGELGMTSTSANLRSIFFGQTACKKNPYGSPQHSVNSVAVLGAGLMGAGIAEVTVKSGHEVFLKDKTYEGLNRGEQQIAKNFDSRVKRRRMQKFEADKLKSRVLGFTDAENWQRAFGRADAVIEAVFEEIGLKHNVIKEVEPHLPEHAIFASNTSAIPITELAKASKRPEQMVGMHYFSPVEKMPLLEIIPHAGTSKEALAAAYAIGLKQGKTIIQVKDVPGFYVNRCLGPFMVESGALMQEGVEPTKLDKTMKSFGFPVGPITLADEVGVDVANHVQVFLSDKLDDRMGGANIQAMQEMVDNGFIGRKAGKGFFLYDSGNKKSGRQLNPEAMSILSKYRQGVTQRAKDADAETIQHRMMCRFVKEAILCLQDDIINTPVDGDIGAVFGIGFPPFLGGPFRWADAIGTQKLSDMMARFADEVGPHFSPPQLLRDLAKENKKFHSK